jgi:8-hydroxy-5-deazaflavin:NADPH oxidoreductase
MNASIIGLGNIGARLAKNLVDGGARVIVADRSLAKAQTLAAELGPDAEAMSILDAIGEAHVLILAIYFNAIEEFIDTHRDALIGKIVVDPSNPIAPNSNGGFDKIIPADQSAGQIIASLLPIGVRLVKAFGTLGAATLTSGARRSPEPAVLFYATDYPEAGKAVAELIALSGFASLSVGGIDQSIRIEVGGDLHEFGKLGGLVSVDQAKALL